MASGPGKKGLRAIRHHDHGNVRHSRGTQDTKSIFLPVYFRKVLSLIELIDLDFLPAIFLKLFVVRVAIRLLLLF